VRNESGVYDLIKHRFFSDRNTARRYPKRVAATSLWPGECAWLKCRNAGLEVNRE
jgi:hypothetical protein